MTKDNTAPATKADLAAVKEELGAMREAMTADKEEIIRHFDVIAEHIHHEMASANREEIDILKDMKKDHETRITTVERVVGLRAR